VEYFSVIKQNELSTTWMNLRGILLSKMKEGRLKRLHTICFLYMTFHKGKNHSDREQISGSGIGVSGGWDPMREHEGVLWDDRTVPDFCGGYSNPKQSYLLYLKIQKQK
jgi:hypothetical protein